MYKIKHSRTADCVVAGFRWYRDKEEAVGSLLLGLYDDAGVLHHVGVTSAFTMQVRRDLVQELAPLRQDALENHPWRDWAQATDESTRMPGAQSRWSAGKDLSWEPLRARARGGSALRPPAGQALPPRGRVRALAAGQAGAGLPLRPAGSGDPVRAGEGVRGRGAGLTKLLLPRSGGVANDRTTQAEQPVSRRARPTRITKYLKATNRYDKTIVFCEDIDHAARMRQALSNANADICQTQPQYVVQITGDNTEGKRALDYFIDPEKTYPVIATTSKLMSTGVDAPTCKLIVLDQNIRSMTLFKQIIGRGTRLREDLGKSWFTILDFKRATELFADPAFDGDPVQIYEPREGAAHRPAGADRHRHGRSRHAAARRDHHNRPGRRKRRTNPGATWSAAWSPCRWRANGWHARPQTALPRGH